MISLEPNSLSSLMKEYALLKRIMIGIDEKLQTSVNLMGSAGFEPAISSDPEQYSYVDRYPRPTSSFLS